MRGRLQIPIRFKFMLTFLVLVTAVVGMITFSTANLFQADKEAYVNDLTSMISQGVAEESRSWLIDIRDRLAVFADIVGNSGLSPEEKTQLATRVFGRFEDLVALSVIKPGEEPIEVYDAASLERAGLTRELLGATGRSRRENDALADGAVRVFDASASAELPTFTISFALGQESDDGRTLEPAVVEATLSSRKLILLVNRYTAHSVFVTDSAGGLLAAAEPSLLVDDAPLPFAIAFDSLDSVPSASMMVDYDDDGQRMIGAYANADIGGIIAGSSIPYSAAHLASRRLMIRLLTVAGVLLVFAVVLGFVWALTITRPVEHLVAATQRVAKGDFQVEVKADTGDEIGNLAESFTEMASELHRRAEALDEAQNALIQSEKMAAFGQLGAGIAHEIKNPLAGILACAQISKRDVESGSQLHDDLQLIEKETKRCRSIIDNLLRFARQEKSVKAQTNANSVVRDSVAIVNHQMELNKVKLSIELDPELPDVLANGNQLQQVFMNLLINAQQAMDGRPGTIRVSSSVTPSGQVSLVFADDGPGMTPEVREKLFEPFFTTKPAGKGTGLGMSVSYGVVRDHGGTIRVESVEGEGATFTITIPAYSDEALLASQDELSAQETDEAVVVTVPDPAAIDAGQGVRHV